MARPAPKCKLCGVGEAAVPDRNRPSTTWRREVCRKCHGERLIGDLKEVLRATRQSDQERQGETETVSTVGEV